MIFPKSHLATKYLTGLRGVEIGGSAHNAYGLDTINVDYTDEVTVYKEAEVRECGEMLKVDVVADAADLPFARKSYDFVISSHMLEHAYDPISVIQEWERVAMQYLFITVPRKDLTFDKDKDVTPFLTIYERYDQYPDPSSGPPSDDHWSIWDIHGFREFCNFCCTYFNMEIKEFQEKDDKVGNGMTVLFKILDKK